MKKIIAFNLACAAIVAVGFIVPYTMSPAALKNAIQREMQIINRDGKADRLPLPSFNERWESVVELEKQKHPAIHQWMVEHGVIGPVVAQGQ